MKFTYSSFGLELLKIRCYGTYGVLVGSLWLDFYNFGTKGPFEYALKKNQV